MDKEDVVCIFNEILFSHEKEGNLAICENMIDLEGIMLSEVSQRTTNPAWYHLYVESEKAKPIETVKW